ncbi:GTP 3',8-cyclase MoaA [Armatimonas rosea]|uniref:GTP 3',8-cyclase n=1 Tax=Armatimonas rosea TaxID=685828 RepID=A0A7W9W7S4_ARMRO|nr:GTP 3',8-cyclase MoaA [Armatimonas rosea]MBB6052759.1 cyclic pyranopterin phosphate synthase [Armatimonas rosea]
MTPLPLALSDRFGRRIEYLRVSLTDRCNLRCVYCMPEAGVPFENLDNVLSFEELVRIIRVLASVGLKKVRLTGGEPLVRKGVPELAAQLMAIPGLEEVTLTTNGILLERDAQGLWDAGIRRLNLSMDTLQEARFEKLARRAEFARAWAGLETALAIGFSPIKLNCVLMRGINDDEVAAFGRLTQERPLSVRFLEYMPIGEVSPAQWRAHYVSNEEALATLQRLWPDLETLNDSPESTSRNFRIPGALGTIGVINPISHKFCDGCNRLRLTANGKLVPCLSDNFEYDLIGPLRAGCSDQEILEHTAAALVHKPIQSDFEGRLSRGGSLRMMSQIGG